MEDRVINRSSKRITNPYGNGHHGVDLGWSKNEEDNKIYAKKTGKMTENVIKQQGFYIDTQYGVLSNSSSKSSFSSLNAGKFL